MTIMDKVITEYDNSADVSEENETNSENPNATNSLNELDKESNEDEEKGINLGWADSIAKVLKTNKPKGKKALALSKAKKITDLKRKLPETTQDPGFEIDGEAEEEKIDTETKEEKVAVGPPRKKKKEIPTYRVKPDILDRTRERTLSKIATRGVVQLFNAVRAQQKDIAVKLQEAGPLERKREKVLKNIDKRTFLNVLMGNSKSENVDNSVKSEEDEIKDEGISQKKVNNDKPVSTWNVLRDDFMMGARLKDWDKNLSGDESSEQENVSDSD